LQTSLLECNHYTNTVIVDLFFSTALNVMIPSSHRKLSKFLKTLGCFVFKVSVNHSGEIFDE
jgi:hypothetical protein